MTLSPKNEDSCPKPKTPSNNGEEETFDEDLPQEHDDSGDEPDPLEEKQKQVDEYKTKWLRAQADFENYRKRIQKEMAQNSLYAAEPMVTDLLQVMDNFERALSSAKDSEDDPMFKGIHLIYQQMKDLLTKHNIKEIEAMEKPFDPHYHDAVMMVETDQYDDGIVVEVLQKGYTYHTKVIRPSMVNVSKK